MYINLKYTRLGETPHIKTLHVVRPWQRLATGRRIETYRMT